MKNFLFLSISYGLALFFIFSFFLTLSYIFSFHLLAGMIAIVFLICCSYLLFTDTEPIEKIEVNKSIEPVEA